MNRVTIAAASLVLATMACGGTSSNAATCAAYAAELRIKASTMTSQELSAYIDDTSEHVAELIVANPNSADICAEAVLEALFTTGVDELIQDQD